MDNFFSWSHVNVLQEPEENCKKGLNQNLQNADSGLSFLVGVFLINTYTSPTTDVIQLKNINLIIPLNVTHLEVVENIPVKNVSVKKSERFQDQNNGNSLSLAGIEGPVHNIKNKGQAFVYVRITVYFEALYGIPVDIMRISEVVVLEEISDGRGDIIPDLVSVLVVMVNYLISGRLSDGIPLSHIELVSTGKVYLPDDYLEL